MRLAIHALLEEGRQDLAHQVEQKIHASELALEGRRDEKALRSRETAPSSGQMAEILGYAANLWKKWDKQERATKVWDLSRHFLEQHNRGRVSRKKLVAAEREHGQRRDKEAGRLEHLQKQVAELRHALERLRAELGELRRNPN
jgi:hypothetical protein